MDNQIEQKMPELKLLKGSELDSTVKSLAEDRGLNPKTVQRFLRVDSESVSRLGKVDKWIPPALFAGYLLTYAATKTWGAQLPGLVELPTFSHELLQAVHNLGNNAAETPWLRDHLPYISLEFSVAWAGLKTLPNFLHLKGKGEKIEQLQTEVKRKIEKGEMRYEMAKGHTAAFVGNGDWLADQLQAIKPADQFMQYAHLKINKDVWQLIEKDRQQEEIFSALDRGDFAKAGEVLILPVKKEDMFLPADTGHDMTLDEIEGLISMTDAYCVARKIPLKRVIIVGRATLKEDYIERDQSGIIKSQSKTLNDLQSELEVKRVGVSTEIYDVTAETMKKIKDLAAGREITYRATKASDERYGERFYEALGEYRSTAKSIVTVHYNINEKPTETGANSQDIAAVLDPSTKAVLIQKGMSEENIILVPELVLKDLSLEVEKN